jgi:hypothetical protein
MREAPKVMLFNTGSEMYVEDIDDGVQRAGWHGSLYVFEHEAAHNLEQAEALIAVVGLVAARNRFRHYAQDGYPGRQLFYNANRLDVPRMVIAGGDAERVSDVLVRPETIDVQVPAAAPDINDQVVEWLRQVESLRMGVQES